MSNSQFHVLRESGRPYRVANQPSSGSDRDAAHASKSGTPIISFPPVHLHRSSRLHYTTPVASETNKLDAYVIIDPSLARAWDG
ncbi:hypothetical protein E4U21_003826 [Claviceps maximensis]|nr:hypothetical protein E4U21_003826 [Claviceps maximensis]